MLPILNEKDFWLSYNSVEGDVEYEMPMLVLQGVLFISSGVRCPFSLVSSKANGKTVRISGND